MTPTINPLAEIELPPTLCLVVLTDIQVQALAWVAGESDPKDYLRARNTEILNSYVDGYNRATAVVAPEDLGQAYLAASTEQQQQIADILGVPTTAAPAAEA